MELKIFLYNDLIQKEKLNSILRGHGMVTNIVPSFIKNCRLFDYRHVPVAFLEEDLYRKSRMYVYGALVTVECDMVALKCIDGYVGCSKSILLQNHISDLFFREEILVYPIKVKNIDNFLKMDYLVDLPEKALVYLGNKDNKLFSKIRKDRHRRMGFFYKDFLTLFNTGIDIH